MNIPINLDQLIAMSSLLVAAIVAIANSKRNSKANVDMLRKEAERQQRISDKLATIGSSVDETRAMVQLIDNKLEQHGTQITRLEAKVDEQERRITVLEKRCERHFGEQQLTNIETGAHNAPPRH